MTDARLFEVPRTLEAPVESSSDYGLISKAVELLLAAQLMLRGHHVSMPLQDDGVDLVVDYRTLVQVKSSATRTRPGMLYVQFDGRRFRERKTGSRKGRIRADIDIVACYARDTERWWFIPKAALEDAGSDAGVPLYEGRFPTRAAAPFCRYLAAWDIFDDAGAA